MSYLGNAGLHRQVRNVASNATDAWQVVEATSGPAQPAGLEEA